MKDNKQTGFEGIESNESYLSGFKDGKESKHTPGPWVNDGSLIIGGVNPETYDGTGGVVICDMNPETEYETHHPEEFVGNCKLVASAPQLKEDNEAMQHEIARLKAAYKEQITVREKSEKENEKLRSLESNFYMDICRAYNAGKENMAAQRLAKGTQDDGKAFISSHDYFTNEFPEFKTNVP